MPEKAEHELRQAVESAGGEVRLHDLAAQIEFDEKQSIGKRYARMDEAGCPFCFRIDGDTLESPENASRSTTMYRDSIPA
jgi:glycyl-tRNA synthetase (class II)